MDAIVAIMAILKISLIPNDRNYRWRNVVEDFAI